MSIYRSNEKKCDADCIRRSLSLLTIPGEVREIRSFDPSPSQHVFRDNSQQLATDAEKLSGRVSGVYITLNPVDHKCLSRTPLGMCICSKGGGASNTDIIRRTRILIDFDSHDHATGESSTEEVHAACITQAGLARDWLLSEGFPEPLYADSGNGSHLIIAVDLPNDDASTLLVKDLLAIVSAKFTTDLVCVDRSVCNAGRLTKIYGTMVKKGNDTPDRPHRLSSIISAPDQLTPVSKELLTTFIQKHEGLIIRKKDSGKKKGKGSGSARLVQIVRQCCSVFCDGAESFARIRVNNRRDVVRIQSQQYRRWITSTAMDHNIIPTSKNLGEVLAILDADSARNKPSKVYTRIARPDPGDTIYLDLCNDNGEVVVITAGGWTITNNCPVDFLRHDDELPMTTPVSGGSWETLQKHLNVTVDDFPLLRGWILDCYRCGKSFLSCIINGEQGSAKSTLTDYLRLLIDPVQSPKRKLSRCERDAFVMMSNNAVLCFDNVSTLPAWFPDFWAALATGIGYGTRQLYSNGNEFVFHGSRPFLLNGIPDFAHTPDVLDRSIKIVLPRISDESRKPDCDLYAAFQSDLPLILGAVCDSLVNGLKHFSSMNPQRLPRMADSACWIMACEQGLSGVMFADAYEHNRRELSSIALEGSVVGDALVCLLRYRNETTWTTTASALLRDLKPETWNPSFPTTPSKLSSELKRIAPELSRMGVEVEFSRNKNSRSIVFKVNRDQLPSNEDDISLDNPTSDPQSPSLKELTGGDIPYPINYQLHPRSPSTGSQRVEFDLSPSQFRQLSREAQSTITKMRPGRYSCLVSPSYRDAR